MYYINIVYIKNFIQYKPDPNDPEGGGSFNKEKVNEYGLLLLIGIIYSTIYDIT
jgi:hypothetical protein